MATKKTAAKTTASKKAASDAGPADTKGVTAKKAPAKASAKEVTVDVQAGSGAPTHAEIAKLAHKYFEERGGHHGSNVGDWLRAEKELKG